LSDDEGSDENPMNPNEKYRFSVLAGNGKRAVAQRRTQEPPPPPHGCSCLHAAVSHYILNSDSLSLLRGCMPFAPAMVLRLSNQSRLQSLRIPKCLGLGRESLSSAAKKKVIGASAITR
jgi:hypothetical protein